MSYCICATCMYVDAWKACSNCTSFQWRIPLREDIKAANASFQIGTQCGPKIGHQWSWQLHTLTVKRTAFLCAVDVHTARIKQRGKSIVSAKCAASLQTSIYWHLHDAWRICPHSPSSQNNIELAFTTKTAFKPTSWLHAHLNPTGLAHFLVMAHHFM